MEDGLTRLLHPKGIGGLDVEVCGILVLLLTAAEQGESAGCAGERLVCLGVRVPSVWSWQDWSGPDGRTFCSSARGS